MQRTVFSKQTVLSLPP